MKPPKRQLLSWWIRLSEKPHLSQQNSMLVTSRSINLCFCFATIYTLYYSPKPQEKRLSAQVEWNKSRRALCNKKTGRIYIYIHYIKYILNILYYIILYYIILSYIILYCIILNYITLYYIILNYIILNYVILYYIILY